MLTRTPRWTFDEAGFAADVARIMAEQRARRALYRQAWDRAAERAAMLQSLEDHDDSRGDRPVSQRR